MIEIINHYSTRPAFDKSKLIISHRPSDRFGLQFVLHTRLFVFDQTGGYIHIDFVQHDIVRDTLYIVPPLHFHHLNPSNGGDFICIDVANDLLKSYHKRLLYAIKYSREKSLPAPANQPDNCSFSNLKLLKEAGLFNEQYLTGYLLEGISGRIAPSLASRKEQRNYNHLEVADRFLQLLTQKKLTLDSCKVNRIATELFCTERTLHRICINTFGLCARNVSNYHFTVKALYLLADERLSYSDVAAELCFSSVTSFNHFVKKFTGFTPSQIRHSFRATGL